MQWLSYSKTLKNNESFNKSYKIDKNVFLNNRYQILTCAQLHAQQWKRKWIHRLQLMHNFEFLYTYCRLEHILNKGKIFGELEILLLIFIHLFTVGFYHEEVRASFYWMVFKPLFNFQAPISYIAFTSPEKVFNSRHPNSEHSYNCPKVRILLGNLFIRIW